MPVIEVRPQDLPAQFRQTYDEMKKRAIRAIRVTVKTVGMRIVQEEISRARPMPVYRGTYRRNFHAEDIENGVVLYNSTPYAAIIEYGRRPGGRMPPIDLITEWVRRKGIGAFIGPMAPGQRRRRPTAAAIRSIGYMVARAIQRRGLRGLHILARAEHRLLPEIQQAVDQALGAVNT